VSQSPTTSVPCEDQIGSAYHQSMMQCGLDPFYPETWVPTILDPNNCEGYCEPPPPAQPCDQQFGETIYGETVLQCSLDPKHPGEWVHTNLNPYNCQGYCKRLTLSPLPCDKQKKSYYYQCKQECIGDKQIPCFWVTTDSDPLNCQGYCKRLPSPTAIVQTTIPCKKQIEGVYHDSVLRCEGPRFNGEWIPTNLDPLNCEGYCNFNISTPKPSKKPMSLKCKPVAK
jgi:hypothetical protein